MKPFLRLVCILFVAAGLCWAQEPPAPQEPGQGQETQAERPERPGFGQQQSSEPRPYERVITKDARSKQGIFTVHEVKDKWFYEIPKAELNKDFLWVTQLEKSAGGVDRSGFLSRVVRWERVKNRILLRAMDYEIVASPDKPIARGVAGINNSSILMSFPVAAWGKDEAAVIEVTRLLTVDSIAEISAKNMIRQGNLDPTRTYVERISAFPTNIETVTTFTYSTPIPSATAAGSGPGRPSPFSATGRPGSNSFVVHYSMIKLPEQPMKPRFFDDRVGFFTTRFTDYGTDEQKVREREYIARWRLEKKDPHAAVSEPVKPIVYYIDPATPKEWVPFVMKGVEDWQPAFEAAGFKHAIIAREAPSPEQDPDWSAEDARYSVIKWLPSTTENAQGPHIADPRSGETLNAPISIWHNILNLQRTWYFLQAGALDPRAQKLPLPVDLMGKLIEFVVAHEVGHTLGLQHNMLASSMYPFDKIRDKQWLHTMGHTPSIMDYSRFNYVAQPEDKIPVDDLVPRVGPYDVFAIKWGYTPIDNAKTAEDEKGTLDKWAREQDTKPWLRFSTPKGNSDPGDETEAVGDADAVAATTLGVKNLERVSKMLISATSYKAGEDYDDLGEMYGSMLGQWTLEMGHVAHVVGGAYAHNKHIGQDGVIFTAVPGDRQKGALQFLVDNAFHTPAFMIDPALLRRIEPDGAISRIANAQRRILQALLAPDKLARMQEAVAVDHAPDAYAPVAYLDDLRKGVWTE
ncbi:MAG: zinc-dependent metalloprotease, partial [Terriglobales bacterium]